MLLIAGEIIQVKTDAAEAEKATHTMSPKSSYSSFIAISFPELSFAFPMLKVAKMDAIVSHT